MSQVITAPSTEKPKHISVFLAGGITNCKEWQKEVTEELKDYAWRMYNRISETDHE